MRGEHRLQSGLQLRYLALAIACGIAIAVGAFLGKRHHEKLPEVVTVPSTTPAQHVAPSVRAPNAPTGKLPTLPDAAPAVYRLQTKVVEGDRSTAGVIQRYQRFAAAAKLTPAQEQDVFRAFVDAKHDLEGIMQDDTHRMGELVWKADKDPTAAKEIAERRQNHPLLQGYAGVYDSLVAELRRSLSPEQMEAFERSYNPHLYAADIQALPLEPQSK